MILSPGKFLGMKRLSDQNGIFKMTAVDQRPPIQETYRRLSSYQKLPGKKLLSLKEC